MKFELTNLQVRKISPPYYFRYEGAHKGTEDETFLYPYVGDRVIEVLSPASIHYNEITRDPRCGHGEKSVTHEITIEDIKRGILAYVLKQERL